MQIQHVAITVIDGAVIALRDYCWGISDFVIVCLVQYRFAPSRWAIAISLGM